MCAPVPTLLLCTLHVLHAEDLNPDSILAYRTGSKAACADPN